MKCVAVIPARMGSTRFPGKPLADICGLPMIEHVRRRAALCPDLAEVVVATCDAAIFDAVTGFGGRAVMTADTHERCTDRIAEAALSIRADVIVNIQGDEPLFHPGMVTELLAPFKTAPDLPCTNLMAPIESQADFESKDVVKTVARPDGFALYFSREPVPSPKMAKGAFARYKQLGVMAFQADFLQLFTSLPPTPLEAVESVDMLRCLEHGHPVRMVVTSHASIGVDTPADLERARTLMRSDPLAQQYLPL